MLKNTFYFFLTLFAILVYCYSANAQVRTDTQQCSQGFIDSSAKCFAEVVVLRDYAEALQNENAALKGKEVLMDQRDALKDKNIAELKDIISALKTENEALRKLKCPTTKFSLGWGLFTITQTRCS